MATLITIHPDNPQDRLINRAVDTLARGGVIAYPTDTVYGIGCDIFQKNSIERIFQIKGKSHKSPLSFICPDLKDISNYAYVSNRAYRVMRHLLPGPYTFIIFTVMVSAPKYSLYITAKRVAARFVMV